EVAGPDHTDDGPEDLLPRDAHRHLDIIEHCGLDEKASAASAASTNREPGAFLLPQGDELQVGVHLLSADRRTHLHAVLCPVSDDERCGRRTDSADKLVSDSLLHDDPAGGSTRLAGQAEAATDGQTHGKIEVGIPEDYKRILSPHLQLDARKMR